MSVTLKMEKLGSRAKGGYGPAKSGPVDSHVIDALKSKDFLIKAPQWFIGGCGDERFDISGQRLLLPSVFGGFFTAVIADALTVRKWYKPGMTVKDHAEAMLHHLDLKFSNIKFCVHTDTKHVNDLECGCAAIAKAAAVIQMMIDNQDLIARLFAAQIVAHAKELLKSGYFQPGTAKLVKSLEGQGVQKEVLVGDHDGKLIVVNDLNGLIYDRPKLYKHFQEQGLPIPYFFAYDRWSWKQTAKAIMKSGASSHFFAGGDAFNRVVPLAICTEHTPKLTVTG